MNIKIVTHKNVRDYVIEKHKSINKSKKSIENIISTHNVYLKTFDISLSDDASDLKNIDKTLKNFQKIKNYPESTWATKKTYVFYLYNAYLNLLKTKNLPNGFNQRLAYLIELSGKQLKEIQNETGISDYLIGLWRKNIRPSQRNLHHVERLEMYFEVEKGTLSNQLSSYLLGSKKENYKNVKPSEHGKFTNLATKEPYSLKNWNEEAESVWNHMQEYFYSDKSKTELEIVVDGIVQKKTIIRNPKAHWESHRTRDLKRWFCNSFFGFLTLPVNNSNPRLCGLGISKEKISLALLTDPELIEKYMAFRRERSRWGFEKQHDGKKKIVLLKKNGVYSRELYKFLEFVITLTKKRTGYLRQRPDLKCKIDTKGLSWDEWIENSISRVVEIKNTFKFVKHRTLDEKIGFILADPNPCRFLKILVDNLEKEVLPHPAHNKVEFHDIGIFIDYLLCALFWANPLRVEMYSKMKLSENIFKDEDTWYISFKPKDFKNVKGAANKHYREPIPNWAGKIIDDYMQFYRQKLTGGGVDPNTGKYECLYFLRPVKNRGEHYSQVRPFSTSAIRSRLYAATLRFLPETGSGFSSQSFRHIVATDYLKAHPHSYMAVAGILHDTLQTVLSTYGHLSRADHMRLYNKHTEAYYDQKGVNKSDDLKQEKLEKTQKRENELLKEVEVYKQKILELESLIKKDRNNSPNANEQMDKMMTLLKKMNAKIK
jgi:integrase